MGRLSRRHFTALELPGKRDVPLSRQLGSSVQLLSALMSSSSLSFSFNCSSFSDFIDASAAVNSSSAFSAAAAAAAATVYID